MRSYPNPSPKARQGIARGGRASLRNELRHWRCPPVTLQATDGSGHLISWLRDALTAGRDSIPLPPCSGLTSHLNLDYIVESIG